MPKQIFRPPSDRYNFSTPAEDRATFFKPEESFIELSTLRLRDDITPPLRKVRVQIMNVLPDFLSAFPFGSGKQGRFGGKRAFARVIAEPGIGMAKMP